MNERPESNLAFVRRKCDEWLAHGLPKLAQLQNYQFQIDERDLRIEKEWQPFLNEQARSVSEALNSCHLSYSPSIYTRFIFASARARVCARMSMTHQRGSDENLPYLPFASVYTRVITRTGLFFVRLFSSCWNRSNFSKRQSTKCSPPKSPTYVRSSP